nr:ESPR domain-containing protein [Escherichia coli]
MKRHLNTSYRLVWNHITGTLVVASELALTGKTHRCGGCAVSCCCHISPALAADTLYRREKP